MLLLSHQRRLFQYIFTLLPNLQDAEDVLQETNLVVWSKLDQFQPGTSFFAWAARIAQHKVMKHREKAGNRRRLVWDDTAVELIADDAVVETQDVDSVRAALQHCLTKLRQEDRELVSRRYAAGASGKRLAEELGRPQNSVYKSLGRIRQALLDCITRAMSRAAKAGGVG